MSAAPRPPHHRFTTHAMATTFDVFINHDDADATYSNFAWNRQVWEEQQDVLGPDPWKFGIKGNEKVLNTLIRYADEQGLLAKKVTIADLFIQIDE